MTTTRDLLAGIIDGDHDEALDSIAEAVRERRKAVRDREGRLNALTLKPGVRVTLKGLSPQYLNGAIVEVVKVNTSRVVVTSIDGVTSLRAAGRIRSGSTVPLSCVEAVEVEA
jgi:hypothetical protein